MDTVKGSLRRSQTFFFAEERIKTGPRSEVGCDESGSAALRLVEMACKSSPFSGHDVGAKDAPVRVADLSTLDRKSACALAWRCNHDSFCHGHPSHMVSEIRPRARPRVLPCAAAAHCWLARGTSCRSTAHRQRPVDLPRGQRHSGSATPRSCGHLLLACMQRLYARSDPR